MTKLAPEWVRTSDPVIRSPARYRWTTAPAVEMREEKANVAVDDTVEMREEKVNVAVEDTVEMRVWLVGV